MSNSRAFFGSLCLEGEPAASWFVQWLWCVAGGYLKGCFSFHHHCDDVDVGFKLGESWSLSFYKPPNFGLLFSSSKFLQSSISDPVQEWQRENPLPSPMSLGKEARQMTRGKGLIDAQGRWWILTRSGCLFAAKGTSWITWRRATSSCQTRSWWSGALEDRCDSGSPWRGVVHSQILALGIGFP